MGRLLTINEFINRSNQTHNSFYDYKNVIYVNRRKKVDIVCPFHGNFKQLPNSHMDGHGCKQCIAEKNRKRTALTTQDFINISRKKYYNKYEYNCVVYKNNHTKVQIRCPKHGIFNQLPFCHMQGQGCKFCRESKGEKKIQQFFKNNNITYERQKRFDDCRYKNPLPFDFYIQNLHMCVEYDGEQHFVGWHRKSVLLEDVIHRDNIKNEYCKNKALKLLRISYKDYNNIETILGLTLGVI